MLIRTIPRVRNRQGIVKIIRVMIWAKRVRKRVACTGGLRSNSSGKPDVKVNLYLLYRRLTELSIHQTPGSLDSRRPRKPVALPQKLRAIVSPLNLQVWTQRLAEHPDIGFKEYILRGLRLGFRIGFQHGKGMCTSAKSNMLSANQNPGVVDEYLQKEVRLGRVIGPMVREELVASSPSEQIWGN